MRVSENDVPQTSLGSRIARPALALGSGALVAFSLPPWGFWPLAFAGIALFGLSVGPDATRRHRALSGWLFGAGWMFFGMGWMIQLTAPGYVVAGAIFAGYHALAALIAPTGRWSVIGRPAAHALAEALRFSFPFGGVPLASLGISQVGGPFAGIARVGGVILIAFVVFLLGSAIPLDRLVAPPDRRRVGDAEVAPVEAVVPRSGRLRIGAAVAGFVIAAIGAFAPSGSATGETLRIAAVQGGGEQGTTALDVPSRVVTERHLEATAAIGPGVPEYVGLDVVFWPENAIDVATFEGSEIQAFIAAESRRLGVPFVIGLTEDAVVDGRDRYTNAQVVVDADGVVSSRYDKVRRVPFGEYVPLRSVIERISSAVDRVGDAVPGETPAFLDLPTGERVSTVISWEVFFGGRAREGVELGAEVILNPTNGASYTGTIVQTQQVASSRLRAIETGRWVVQAAPTGFSAFIDSDGDVLQRTGQREQRIIVSDVELRTGNTWYVSLGDAPFILALVLVLIAACVASRGPLGSRSVRPRPSV